jgi:hypothetical protein
VRLTDDGTREFEVDELEKIRGVSRGLYKARFVDGRVGHCDVGRRAGALDWRKGGAEGGTLYRGWQRWFTKEADWAADWRSSVRRGTN